MAQSQALQRVVLSTTMLISFLGLAIVIPVFAPLLLNSATSSLVERAILLGFLIGIYPLMGLFGTPLTEALSDRLGRKPLMLLTLFFAAVGYVLCAVGVRTNHIGLLFLARIIGGFAGGSATIVIQTISDERDAERRNLWIGSMATIGGVGFLIGPLLGGKLADPRIVSWFNNATPFWIATGLLILNLLLVLFFLRETIQFKGKSPYNIFRSWHSFVEPFRIASLKKIAWILLLFGTAWSFFVDFFPVYLVQKWEFTPAQIGDFYIYVTAWYFITQWFLIGPANRWLQSPRLLPTLLLIAPFALLALLFPWEANWEYLIAPFTIISMTMALPVLFAILPASARWESGEQLARISHALQTAGYIAAPILGGFLAAWFAPLPTLVAALCALIAWVILMGLYRKGKERA